MNESNASLELDHDDVFLQYVIPSEIRPDVGYRVERLLGQGGTARAYYAIRTGPDGQQPVVVKIILPQIVRSSDKTASMVIKKEAVALGRLNERVPRCPYVVRFIDTGVIPFSLNGKLLSLPWLAIEYVDGGIEGSALDERVLYSLRATGCAFDPERAARAVRALSRGLEEIHAVGVVHRDLTPANVLCCGNGATEMFKISDFGIARPIGLSVTFGNVPIGTPGYVAPEQTLSINAPVGPHTDIFALAAVVYCLLTGEHYFRATTTIEAFQEIQSGHRSSLANARGLCPELKNNPAAIAALDMAFARATAADPKERPATARVLADSILPWLGDQPRSVHVSTRWLECVSQLDLSPSRIERTWLVRRPPGDDRVVLGAAWNADGQCLAATTRGLEYFDGVDWIAVPEAECFSNRRMFNVKQLGPTKWLVVTSGALLVEVAREGTTVIAEGPDRRIDFLDIDGDPEDFAVVLGRIAGHPPLLCTRIGRRWLKPFEASEVAHISALTRLGDAEWLVVGRDRNSRAWAGIYEPLELRLTNLPVPIARALLGCASRLNKNLAVAVGGNGAILSLENQQVGASSLPDQSDLTVVALDLAAQVWAASIGRIYFAQEPLGEVACLWHDPAWTVPFVSLHADIGHLLGLTVDGGVIECRSLLQGAAPT
jgi:eukaryotic-like serine/threonine-protein kinase